jgi:hypothetical protein
MAARLLALCTGRTLLPRNIIIFITSKLYSNFCISKNKEAFLHLPSYFCISFSLFSSLLPLFSLFYSLTPSYYLQLLSLFTFLFSSLYLSSLTFAPFPFSKVRPATNFSPSFFNYSLDSCGFVNVGRPLWREVGSAVFCCCWASPTESFLGLCPAGLTPIFYCLNIETPSTWRARFPYLNPPGTGYSVIQLANHQDQDKDQGQAIMRPTVSPPVRLGNVPLLELVSRC